MPRLVHHLHEVARPPRPHPLAARLPIFGLGRHGLHQGLDQRPAFRRAAGHERRAKQSAFFTAADPRAHIQNARVLQRSDAALGVGVQRVATVNEHIACRQQRAQLRQHLVHRRTRRHHHPDAPGHLQAGHQFGQRRRGLCPQALRAHREVLTAGSVQVKAADRKPVALQVERQVFAHHAQAHKADVHGLHVFHCLESFGPALSPIGSVAVSALSDETTTTPVTRLSPSRPTQRVKAEEMGSRRHFSQQHF